MPLTKMAASALCLVSIVLLSLHVSATGQDYCKFCANHTMCKYKGDGPACKTKITSGVNEDAKAEIMEEHNRLRRLIADGGEKGQPAAADMMELVWNEELAMIAQRWADQCIFGHDTCRKVEKEKYGQIAHYTTSTKKNYTAEWKKSIQSWYNEVKHWKTQNIKPFVFIEAAGHFTQVVWSSTERIGCGFSVYPDKAKIGKLYICNYGPGGNLRKRALYLKGKACSACPTNTTCNKSLCSRNTLNVTTPAPSVHVMPSHPTCPSNAAYYEGKCKTIKDICSKYSQNVGG